MMIMNYINYSARIIEIVLQDWIYSCSYVNECNKCLQLVDLETLYN